LQSEGHQQDLVERSDYEGPVFHSTKVRLHAAQVKSSCLENSSSFTAPSNIFKVCTSGMLQNDSNDNILRAETLLTPVFCTSLKRNMLSFFTRPSVPGGVVTTYTGLSAYKEKGGAIHILISTLSLTTLLCTFGCTLLCCLRFFFPL